ncbi:organic cation transporter protein-like [Octopus vulgaris]|uniref:Organic cation transporter protein-like n=1 Tax=Octopus vulgaris TaxID=6645 RepID=A0AA36BEC6_OCTVU|nr:organic cation transporter protein-like [Octopus vulgaris]
MSDKDITHILEKCGTFGPYQRWFYAYITIICMLCTTPGMNFTFITASVPFLCYPPNFNASLIPANLTENEYLQMLQPDGDDQCSVYNNSFTGTYYTTPSSNSSELQCSYGRKFLTEKFSSVVSEFDLVCERKWLKSTLQSMYFAGYLIGSIVFGVLSDRFGRKSIFLLTNTVLVVCGITKIFVPSLIGYIIVYCIQGAGYIGTIISTYALTLEFTSLKLRTPINCWYFSGVQLGGLFLPVYAYAIPDWHYLELALCLLPVINFFISIFLPESPRWLIGKKRFPEAKALLEKVMKKNNQPNEEVLDIFTNMEENRIKNSLRGNTRGVVLPKKRNHTFIDLFKTSWLALITLNICFTWMVCSMLYYGVTLNSLDMAGNRYINVFIIMAIEFPSFYCTYYLFTRFDHRKPITFFLVFSGLNCIASNFVTKGSFWFPVILVVLGKFGISGAFTSIFLLSAEIFPTVVRTNGLGIASLSSRIGGISAPFLLQLSYYVKWLPLSIFGLLSVIAGLLLLLLPDTKHRNLPETFEDLDKWKS